MEGVAVGVLVSVNDRIDAEISQWLELVENAPPSLLEAMRYSLFAPGKRLRPRLVIMACVAAGGREEIALPAAAAVEMVHTYSLIHDDLPSMDDDDMRRGQPTCHKKFGDAMAILAGDSLLTLAFHVLGLYYPPAVAAPSVVELALGAGAAGMVGGQVLDLAWENREDGGIAELEAVHAGKTGALFRACLRIGARVAQRGSEAAPPDRVMIALDTFGRAFGLMFQITDDLLDVNGDATATGKRVGKDAGRGKLTYPGLLGVDESRRLSQQLRQEAENAVAPLGLTAKPLMELVRMVCERDR